MLSIFAVLLKPLKQLRDWVGGKPRRAVVAAASERQAEPAIALVQAVPAVAGFVHRLAPPPVDFHLSARLASVAHLNPRAGRKPYAQAKPSATAKAMPKANGSDRKRCMSAGIKPLRAAAVKAPVSSNVVALDTAITRCIPLEIRIQQAA